MPDLVQVGVLSVAQVAQRRQLHVLVQHAPVVVVVVVMVVVATVVDGGAQRLAVDGWLGTPGGDPMGRHGRFVFVLVVGDFAVLRLRGVRWRWGW